MGSSLIFSGTEKKKQDTVVIGSSSSVINKPKETKQEMPKEKPRILTQSQSQNPAVTIKPPMAVPKIGVKQPPTPSTPQAKQQFSDEAKSRAQELLNYLKMDRWLWDMRCWNDHKDMEEVAGYVENPTYKNSGHALYCVEELKEMDMSDEEIIKAIMENPHIQYADYDGEKYLDSIMDAKPGETQSAHPSPTKKSVVVVQTSKKPQPVHQEAVAEKEPPQSQEQTQPQAEEPKDDGVVLGVELVKEATAVLSKVVPKHSSISVLEYVKIESFDSRLRLMGTDLEKSVVIEVPYANKIERLKSPLAVSLEDLKRLSKVKAKELRFGRENGNVLVSYATDRGGRNEVLKKVDLTEFPEIPLPQGEFKMAKGLGLALSEAVQFCAEELSKYALTGILLTNGEVVSSDGKRLYRRLVPELKQQPDVLIPSSKFFELKNLAQQEIGVFVGENLAWLKAGNNISWAGRMIDDKFPDYTQSIPESCAGALTLTEDVIKSMLEVVSSLPYAHDRGVKIEIKQEGNGWKMVFTSTGETHGTAELQGISYEGSEAMVALNPDYLLDALNIAGIKMMGFNGTEDPMLIWGDEVQVLIMPFRDFSKQPQPEKTPDDDGEAGDGQEPQGNEDVEEDTGEVTSEEEVTEVTG